MSWPLLHLSAHSLFLGNKEGWWTGKDLLDYIDDEDEGDAEDHREFINARRVIDGTDKAEKLGRHALEFEKALKAAAYSPRAVSTPTPAPEPKPAPQAPVGATFLSTKACDWFGLFCG